jgi:hypothetical protein
MRDTLQHLVLLVFSVGFSAIGWFMARNPARVYQAFNLGGTQFGQTFFEGFCKIVGWCFAIIFAASALMEMFQQLAFRRRESRNRFSILFRIENKRAKA